MSERQAKWKNVLSYQLEEAKPKEQPIIDTDTIDTADEQEAELAESDIQTELDVTEETAEVLYGNHTTND
jgi:hypothetical protein